MNCPSNAVRHRIGGCLSKDKFVKWLRNLAPPGHGQKTRIAQAVGLGQPYISKLLAGTAKARIAPQTLRKIARHRGVSPEALYAEIYGEDPQKSQALELPAPYGTSETAVVVPIDAKYREDWAQLFGRNPARAKRVLENLALQERHGYTELVSRIVSAILAHGPEGALPSIFADVQKWAAKQTRKSQRKRSTSHTK